MTSVALDRFRVWRIKALNSIVSTYLQWKIALLRNLNSQRHKKVYMEGI